MVFLLEILIVVCGTAGFTIAAYIHATKKAEKSLVCPMEGSCDRVVHSDYSKLFGVNVEVIGMFYYGIIALFYTVFVLFPTFVSDFAQYMMIGISFCGFLFSLYLTFVQTVIIRHWCTWCLFSALMCTSIFALTMFVASTKVLDLFVALR